MASVRTCGMTIAGRYRDGVPVALFANRRYGLGRPAGADRPGGCYYRVIRRPALAEIVGDGRPWTVLMISLLSIPWR